MIQKENNIGELNSTHTEPHNVVLYKYINKSFAEKKVVKEAVVTDLKTIVLKLYMHVCAFSDVLTLNLNSA